MRYILPLVILLSGAFMFAQEAKKPKYQPTELQTLRLQLAQQQAQLAQKDMFIAQQNLQAALAALKAESDKVKQANNWDASVIFNPDTLMFIDAPKPIPVPSGAEK